MSVRCRLAPERLVAPGAAMALLSLLVLAATAQQQVGDKAVAPAAVPVDAEIAALCGAQCHRLPPPDVLPRASWRDTIARMRNTNRSEKPKITLAGTPSAATFSWNDMPI